MKQLRTQDPDKAINKWEECRWEEWEGDEEDPCNHVIATSDMTDSVKNHLPYRN